MKIETPVLRRMGPVPFWRGTEKCLESLETAYRRAMARAAETLERAAARGDASRERPLTESPPRPTRSL